MATSRRRAVITGVGLITPLGLGAGPFWQALREGRSGVRPLRLVDASALPTRFGAEVEGFDAREYLDKKERKRLNQMVRTMQFAAAAAQLALTDAGVDRDQLDPARFGVEFGASTIPGDLAELGAAARASVHPDQVGVDLHRWGEVGLPLVPPMWMLGHIPNMVAAHVSILHNAQGPTNTVSQSDVGGLLALGEAFRILGRDGADAFLVGAADTKVAPITLTRYCLFAEVSRRNDAPERACRPFDRRRDGQVLGEGGGVLLLEELGHALRRNARVYAEVVGFGAAFDPDRSGRGLARAVAAALAEAGVGPGQIDHVNAHGYSTTADDAWEARGLAAVFGNCRPTVPVFAAKSYFGNLGAGGGLVELSASLLALRDGPLPPTLNYEEPDPACPVEVVRGPRPVVRAYFLKLGFTDMGQCAAVVCRRWEGR
jgi:3-oxoacyl-[acyl-carrier-protein] synthase II